MNIIGLDLSITATGVAYPNGHMRTIKGPANHGDARLNNIVKQIFNGGTTLHLAVIEDLLTHHKNAASPGPSLVHGAVRYALRAAGIPYVLVAPATLKAFATGRGVASKTDMAVAALKRAGREFADDNQCDAWWLRHAGLHWYGTPEFDLPAAQRARLDKVAWPQLAEVAL